MSTIFQLTRGELASLLHFLRPHHAVVARGAESDARHLRVLITEWLLLNGLSTLHKFERDSAGKAGKPAWRMPTEVDCQSCGRYRVGKPLYAEEALTFPVIAMQPTQRINQMVNFVQTPPRLYVNGGAPSTSALPVSCPIRSKHGNLQRVHYGLPPREMTPTRASARGGTTFDELLQRRDKPASFRLYSNGQGRLAQSNSHNDGFDQSDSDKCADMCLACLFCECAPPSDVLKKRRNVKNDNHRDKTKNGDVSNCNNCKTVDRPQWRY